METGEEAMGTLRRKPLLVMAALAASFVLAGCSGGSSNGGSGGSTGATTPPTSTGFVPASGTADTGELFPTYTNSEAGYSFRYPGGWRVAEKKTDVRIARFGNSIVAVVRPRDTAPFYKGYQKTLEDQLKKHDDKLISGIVQPASMIKVGKQKVVRAVIEQQRPTGTDTPSEAVVTYRYLYYKDGKLLILNCSSVKGIDNEAAYDLIASTVKWQ
jgi:hypothetical protein